MGFAGSDKALKMSDMRFMLLLICVVMAVAPLYGDNSPGTYFNPIDGNAVATVGVTTNAVVSRTVAFLGGSITEMNGFRPRVMEMLRKRHPAVAFAEIAAGLSSTCSDTGAFRLERDVLAKGIPDIFIVESAVNDDQDGHFDYWRCVRGLEGSVRHMLMVNPRCHVIIGLMVNRRQYEQIKEGETPVPYAAARDVAGRYGVALADVGSALVASERAGGLNWSDYADCHPSPGGCDFSARLVFEAIEKDYDPLLTPSERPIPVPLDGFSYFMAYEMSLGAVMCPSSWRVIRPDWQRIPGNKRAYFMSGEVLESVDTNMCATVSFHGTALAALVTAGPDSGDLEVSVDGGEFRPARLMADHGALHYPHTLMLADNLADVEHTVRFRAIPAWRGAKIGTTVRIHRLGANGKADRGSVRGEKVFNTPTWCHSGRVAL